MRIRRMFIVVFICALLLMFPLPAAGEQMSTPPDSRSSPVEEWSQTFGGSEYDWGNSVAQTSDGGYIIASITYSYGAGNSDIWLIKTGASGVEEWSQTFGGSGQDYGQSVAQTSDGGYIITGSTYSYGAGHSDVWLIKTDADGNQEWNETFGGSGEDHGDSVVETSDGGYIIAGSTQSYGNGSSDVYLIKTDSSGTEEWSQTFGGSEYDYSDSVVETSDGGYIVAGSTESYGAGGSDVWLIETDSSGTEEWSQTFGGSEYDWGSSVAHTSDGGYIIAGSTYSYGAGSADLWLIKTDVSGTEEWNQTSGGLNYEDGLSVVVTSDGGYVITGSTVSYSVGGSDVWLLKLSDSDTTPPNVASTSPTADATGVSLETVVMATFSEAMDASTITAGSFTLAGVSGSVSYNSGTYTATFTPAAGLAYDTTYTASLSTAITDVAGNPLTSTYSWSFTTESVLPASVAVSIDAPDDAAPDSDFTVNINIGEVTDFDSCNYDITFDALVLRLDYVASGLIYSTAVPVDMYNELSSGTYRVIQNVPGVAGISGSGYLAVLHFHVIGSEGDSSAVTISNGVLSDNQAGEITATWAGDSIDITSVVPGDGNGDGSVNALDITKVERVIVGLDAETLGADANGDGNVNAMDITKIELIIAGLD